MIPKRKILIVDDDVALLEMAGEILDAHYQVSLARSGEQALEYLRRAADSGVIPELILLDIDMPGMDGYAALQEIRLLAGLRDVPVVFLTGMTEADYELRGLSLGAVDYIVKPFVKELFLARIKNHLENGARLRSLTAEQAERPRNKRPGISAGIRRTAHDIPLTPWEMKIALLAQERLTQREIAEQLSLSENTVHTALNVIFSKLGVHSKRELSELDLE
jgi:DNA-binding NarL/FixJ family response regulator